MTTEKRTIRVLSSPLTHYVTKFLYVQESKVVHLLVKLLCWLVQIISRCLIILHPKDKVTTDVTKSKCDVICHQQMSPSAFEKGQDLDHEICL